MKLKIKSKIVCLQLIKNKFNHKLLGSGIQRSHAFQFKIIKIRMMQVKEECPKEVKKNIVIKRIMFWINNSHKTNLNNNLKKSKGSPT